MKANNRFIKYFYDFKTSDGVRHCGCNVYDNVFHWITFMNDHRFKPEELKNW